MAEQTYSIPLRREVMKAPRYKRAKKAVNTVREFLMKHSKSPEVKIGKYLNMKLWEQGIKNVPHLIKVETTKDAKGVLKAELAGAPKDVKKEETKKKGEKPAEAATTANIDEKGGKLKETTAAKNAEISSEKETKKEENAAEGVKKETEAAAAATTAPKTASKDAIETKKAE